MTDDDVMDFIAFGYVLLKCVIPDDFNRHCSDLSEENADALVASNKSAQKVLLHHKVAGVARSLLGKDFLVPRGGHHHFLNRLTWAKPCTRTDSRERTPMLSTCSASTIPMP